MISYVLFSDQYTYLPWYNHTLLRSGQEDSRLVHPDHGHRTAMGNGVRFPLTGTFWSNKIIFYFIIPCVRFL